MHATALGILAALLTASAPAPQSAPGVKLHDRAVPLAEPQQQLDLELLPLTPFTREVALAQQTAPGVELHDRLAPPAEPQQQLRPEPRLLTQRDLFARAGAPAPILRDPRPRYVLGSGPEYVIRNYRCDSSGVLDHSLAYVRPRIVLVPGTGAFTPDERAAERVYDWAVPGED